MFCRIECRRSTVSALSCGMHQHISNIIFDIPTNNSAYRLMHLQMNKKNACDKCNYVHGWTWTEINEQNDEGKDSLKKIWSASYVLTIISCVLLAILVASMTQFFATHVSSQLMTYLLAGCLRWAIFGFAIARCCRRYSDFKITCAIFRFRCQFPWKLTSFPFVYHISLSLLTSRSTEKIVYFHRISNDFDKKKNHFNEWFLLCGFNSLTHSKTRRFSFNWNV